MIIPDSKKTATIIVSKMHAPKVHTEHMDEGGEATDEIAECIKEMYEAAQAGDFNAAAEAFRAAFAALESAPHEEYDSDEDTGY